MNELQYEYRHVEIAAMNVVEELSGHSADGFRVVGIEYTKGPREANGSEGPPALATILLERAYQPRDVEAIDGAARSPLA